MYVSPIQKGYQKKLVNLALKKAGSERRLSLFVGIPKGSLYNYKAEHRNLSESRARCIVDFLQMDYHEIETYWIICKLPLNWGRVKGGKNCILSKKAAGTFEESIKLLKTISSKRMKEWHDNMKKSDFQKYHCIQYERFKKIATYTLKTSKGEFVRNNLEKLIADHLFFLGIDYSYEKYAVLHNY